MADTDLITTLLNRPPQPGEPVVASDVEGTITAGFTWEGLRNYLMQHGYDRRYRRWFMRRVPRLLQYRFNLIDREAFKFEWLNGLLTLFAGFSEPQFDEVASWVATEHLWPTRRHAVVDELAAHRAAGRRVVLVTGMMEPVLGHLVRHLDNVDAIGTPLLFEDGVFAGRTAAPYTIRERKVAQLRPFIEDGQVVTAYGDTSADLPMLHLARDPVAVDPDSTLRTAAADNGWRIIEAAA